MKKVASNIPALAMRILKIGTCPTLSAKSTLTYHLGCTPDSEVHFLVSANDGGGFFSQEWVSLKAIQEAFDKGPKPITSFALFPIFRGKSVNTPAFLLAVLKHEGLLKAHEKKQRCYECIAPEGFMTEVNKLIASDIDIKVAAKVVGKGVVRIKKAQQSAPIKKTAASKVKKPITSTDDLKVEEAAPIKSKKPKPEATKGADSL